MFKYLINSYKNDKYKLSKIVESFNETFETDFITKYDLIKEFGDIVNKNPGTRNRNIVLKNSNGYKTLQKISEIQKKNLREEMLKELPQSKTGNVEAKNREKSVKHQSEGVAVTGGNNLILNEKFKKGTYMYNEIKLLQYLTFIDTLHDFHDIDKLKQIYGEFDNTQLTIKLINDIHKGFYKKGEKLPNNVKDDYCKDETCYYSLLNNDNITEMKKKLIIGKDKNNLKFLVEKANNLPSIINKEEKEKYDKLKKKINELYDVLFSDKPNKNNYSYKINDINILTYFYMFNDTDDIKKKTIIENINKINNFKFKNIQLIDNNDVYEIKDINELEIKVTPKSITIIYKKQDKDFELKSEIKNIELKNYNISNNINDTDDIEIIINENNKSLNIKFTKNEFILKIFNKILYFISIVVNNSFNNKTIISDVLAKKTDSYYLIIGMLINKYIKKILETNSILIDQYLKQENINDSDLKDKINNYINDSSENNLINTLTRIFDPGPVPPTSNNKGICDKTIQTKEIGLKYKILLKKKNNNELGNVDILIEPFSSNESTYNTDKYMYDYDSNKKLSINMIYKLLIKRKEFIKNKIEYNKSCKDKGFEELFCLKSYVLYGLKRSGDKGIIESAVKLCDISDNSVDSILITNDRPALFYALLRNCNLIGISIHKNTSYVIKIEKQLN